MEINRGEFAQDNRLKTTEKLKIDLDLTMLDIMCCFSVSGNKYIRRGHLVNLRNVMLLLDMDRYGDEERLKRINFIKKALEGRLDKNLHDPKMILKHATGGMLGSSDNSLVDLNNPEHLISKEGINWVNETISGALKYKFINNNIDEHIDLCMKIKSTDDPNKREYLIQLFEENLNFFKNNFRKTQIESLAETVFSLHESVFDDTVKDIYQDLKSPRSKLYTGMQGLNHLFGGSLMSGRVYSFFGNSGGFKSGILLNLATQIKKFNTDYKVKDPTKRPAIIILTMENGVKESVERLFNIATNANDPIVEYSEEEVLHKLKTEGSMTLSEGSPIDIIIKFVPNRSVDTSYLYTMVEELEDQGVETILVIQDYLKRIRSIDNHADIRHELGEIVNEFKIFCQLKDIPLITAMQLNRDAAKTVETAKTASSQADIIRSLGRHNIGESLLIFENIDWGGIINIEDCHGSDDLYLGIRTIKMRYAAIKDPSVVFLPFVKNSTIKLIEDFYSAVPLYKETLKASTPNMSMNNRFSKPTNKVSSMSSMRGNRTVTEVLMEGSIQSSGNVFEQLPQKTPTVIPMPNNEEHKQPEVPYKIPSPTIPY